MESKFRCQGPRRYVMCATERRQEVVQHIIVGNIDRRQPCTPFVSFAMKQIVMPDRQIKEIPGGNPRRVVVIILSSRRGHFY